MKNEEQKLHTSLGSMKLSDHLEETTLLQWFVNNKRLHLVLLGGLLALFSLLFYYGFSQRSQVESDFLNAEKEYRSLIKGTGTLETQQKAYQNLSLILKRQPTLRPKYEGALAQILIFQNKISEAEPLALSALKRTLSENQPFYTQYAQVTLLIAQQKISEALKNTLELKQRMLQNVSLPADQKLFGEELFAMNLLRIAFLQQQLNAKEGELEAWQEWKKYVGSSPASLDSYSIASAFQKVADRFEEGKISLNNYIENRERILKK